MDPQLSKTPGDGDLQVNTPADLIYLLGGIGFHYVTFFANHPFLGLLAFRQRKDAVRTKQYECQYRQ